MNRTTVGSAGVVEAASDPQWDAPLPLHFRLRRALLTEIREQALQPGDRLPTEAELERRYGVSRTTIRRTMSDLAAEGIVRRVQGKGTFVGVPRIQHVPVLTSFTELLRAQGYTPSHHTLTSEPVAATEAVAPALGIEEGAACRYLRRLFFADRDPVGVAETWLPSTVLGVHEHLLEAEALEGGSLYEVLESEPLSFVLRSAVETISPALASGDDAELLGCEPGTPLLLIERRTCTADDTPVEWTRLRFIGGRYEYRVSLLRPPEEAR